MTATLRRLPGPGAPRFTVTAGARPLGTISNPGPGAPDGSWHGLAPDGTRFAAPSRPKIIEQLQQHARPKQASAAPARVSDIATLGGYRRDFR